jgi:lipid-A-disaccharide synthase
MKSKKILMVAGEASGDLHGAHLMEAIRKIDPEVEFFGMGGEALARAGMTLLYHHRSLSVVGITEVLVKLRPILRALQGLKEALDREKPDLAILIDFPDFNLRLARSIYRRGIPILYYISPQVWAWRASRVKLIARWVRKMIVFFPFEVPLYQAEGVDVEWVGHPLVEVVKPSLPREEAFAHFGLDPERPTVALLPGSRESEVRRLFPIFLTAAQILRKEMNSLQFIVPLASGLPREILIPWLKQASIPIAVVEGKTYDVMNISDLLITASGTATLEGGILGKPMVIAYKVSPLSYLIGRLFIRVDHIGMVNLVAGKGIAPELIQREANPHAIARQALAILRDAALRQNMEEVMREVRHRLWKAGAVERAARIAYALLNEDRVSASGPGKAHASAEGGC